MQDDFTLFAVFVIFTGAAVLGGLALYARQSLLVAYILLGGLLGPWGFRVVTDTTTIQGIGHVGIIFCCSCWGSTCIPRSCFECCARRRSSPW